MMMECHNSNIFKTIRKYCWSFRCSFVVGHSKAVRDISFNNTGTQFLSAAYDRYVKLWDTETGM